MKCRLHVSVDLVPQRQDVPFFACIAPEDASHLRKERTILKCPVDGCKVVAMEYDEELRHPTKCRTCRLVTVAVVGGMCSECAAAYRKRHPVKPHARALHAQHA